MEKEEEVDQMPGVAIKFENMMKSVFCSVKSTGIE